MEPNENYLGTGQSAQSLSEQFGYTPGGELRTAAADEAGPVCPPVSPQDAPFDTTTIPSGCSAPLSQECADYYNTLYPVAPPPEVMP